MNAVEMYEKGLLGQGTDIFYATRERVRKGEKVTSGTVKEVHTVTTEGVKRAALVSLWSRKGFVSTKDCFDNSADAMAHQQNLVQQELAKEKSRHADVMRRLNSAQGGV